MSQEQTILKYGHSLTSGEIEVIDNVLKHGRGLAIRNKKDLRNYPNLINNQLVYVDYWAGISLKATDKGTAHFNNLIQL